MEQKRLEAEHIGRVVQALLKKKDFSYRDVERETGISKSTLFRNLKLGYGFTDTQLVRLASMLDVKLSTIVKKAEALAARKEQDQ